MPSSNNDRITMPAVRGTSSAGRRRISTVLALIAMLSVLSVAPATAGVDQIVEVRAGSTFSFDGSKAPGFNSDYFSGGQTCTKEAKTYCDVLLLKITSPISAEEAASGIDSKIEPVSVRIKWAGSAAAQAGYDPTDFDLVAYRSDEFGSRGELIDYGTASTSQEQLDFDVTTSKSAPSEWVLVHVVYYRVPNTDGYTGLIRAGDVSQAPVVRIGGPEDSATFTEGKAVTFSGAAEGFDGDDLSPAIEWASDLDGRIGSGASFTTSSLSAGTHQITAGVSDSSGESASDSITIEIVPADDPEGAGVAAPVGLACAVVAPIAPKCVSEPVPNGPNTTGFVRPSAFVQLSVAADSPGSLTARYVYDFGARGRYVVTTDCTWTSPGIVASYANFTTTPGLTCDLHDSGPDDALEMIDEYTPHHVEAELRATSGTMFVYDLLGGL